jgi:hypothetical protein
MPSYVKSASVKGLGTVLSIGDVPTAVGELQSIELSGRQWATDDVTNFDSPAAEFLTTIKNPGSWAITGKRVGGNAGQIALEAAYASGDVTNFVIQFLPTGAQTIGDKFTFAAAVTELNYGVASDKAQTFTGSLKISGALAFVAGTTS